MAGQMIPLFQEGKILTHQMLQAISNYAVGFGELAYEGYSEGIIRGCALTAARDALVVGKGMVRYGGHVYLVEQPMMVSYVPANKWTVLYLVFKEETMTSSFLYREVELVLSHEISTDRNHMELGRFKLMEGARLRLEHQDLKDHNTEFDTVNYIYSIHSGWERPTISPEILYDFARENCMFAIRDPWDISFCQKILADGKIPQSRDCIIAYVVKRLNLPRADYSNLELYEGLCEITRSNAELRWEEPKEEKRKKRMVMLDY